MQKQFVLLNQRPIERVEQMIRRRLTGCLNVTGVEANYCLEFANGRLIDAIGSSHRVRRWQQAIARHLPSASQLLLIDDPHWERATLEDAILHGRITRSQARGILRDLCREVLFSLSGLNAQPVTWKASQMLPMASMTYGLSVREVEQLCQDSRELAQHWQHLQLGWENIHRAPVLDEELDLSQSVFGDLIAAFDGHHRFWDLVYEHDSSPFAISRILHHFLEQGIIRLQTLPDLPLPSFERRPSDAIPAPKKKSRQLMLKTCQMSF